MLSVTLSIGMLSSYMLSTDVQRVSRASVVMLNVVILSTVILLEFKTKNTNHSY